MKKLVVLLATVVMVLSCVACGGKEVAGNNAAKVEIADANEILTKAWDEYKTSASEEIQFPVAGGNVEAMVMDASAKFELTYDSAKEVLVYSYCIPEESIDMTDDIATMMNMMMANNFTSAAYHVADAANVETVVSSIKDATLNNQWMCGFPEKLIIVTIDNYVVSAFGNGMVIDAFKTAITTVYGDAAVVSVEESLM